MPKVLVIDDESSILHAFRRAFEETEFEVLTASEGHGGLQTVERERPDVIVLDLNLPDISGLEVFQKIRGIDARIPVIFITGHGTTETAIEAMKGGAFDYLLKPLRVAQIRDLVERAAEISRLSRVPAMATGEGPPKGSSDILVGRSPAMQEVYKAIGRVASQDLAVLVLGESGTGKELVARAIYQHSRRSNAPFLAVNCAAIPESLLESELFGHEKGAFTGADRKRIGKFEQCAGGTIFLDEIGDMTSLTQAKVLRVLQDGTFERVGGNETIKSNARVIAATNRDLPKMAISGEFRDDLYYRLSVITISLPALRDRTEDLPELVEHFLRRFSPELGKEVYHASPEAIELLKRYPWPGNLRELQSVLKWALLRAQGPILVPDFLPASVVSGEPQSEETTPSINLDWDAFLDDRIKAGSQDLYAEALARVERSLIKRVLRHTSGNQLQAAKILGITRGSLRTKIRTLGIQIDRSIWSEDDQ